MLDEIKKFILYWYPLATEAEIEKTAESMKKELYILDAVINDRAKNENT